MKNKVCVIYRSDENYIDEAKKDVLEVMKHIPPDDFKNVEVFIDYPPDDAIVGEGIDREYLVNVVTENLFDIKAIYTDSVITFSHDMVEVNIFIALMHLLGIKVYATMETTMDAGLLYPDPVYLGEIQKVIRKEMQKNPFCILNATEEQKNIIRAVVADVMLLMWDQYRTYK